MLMIRTDIVEDGGYSKFSNIVDKEKYYIEKLGMS